MASQKAHDCASWRHQPLTDPAGMVFKLSFGATSPVECAHCIPVRYAFAGLRIVGPIDQVLTPVSAAYAIDQRSRGLKHGLPTDPDWPGRPSVRRSLRAGSQ